MGEITDNDIRLQSYDIRLDVEVIVYNITLQVYEGCPESSWTQYILERIRPII